jgi:hypothetical protein
MAMATRRERFLEQEKSPWKQWGGLVLLVFGVLIIVGLLIDMRTIHRRRAKGSGLDVATDIQNVLLGLTGERVSDPRGFFTIVPPSGWKMSGYPDSHPFNVTFYGPHGVDINITASAVEYNDYNTLLKRIEQIEREIGMNTHIEPVTFLGRPAIKRTSNLHRSRVLVIDFVEHRVAHHLLCRIPHELFDKYEPVVMEVLNTYEPLRGKGGRP